MANLQSNNEEKSHDRTDAAILVKENEASDRTAPDVEANSDATQPESTKLTADEVESEGLSDDEPQPPDFKPRGPISYNSSGRPKPSKPSKPR